MPSTQDLQQSSNPAEMFRGPIFLVGMPRSGTKLLRSMLNNHSQIAIMDYESHFIPYYLRRTIAKRSWREFTAFQKLYRELSQTYFFHRVTESGFHLSAEEWHALAEQKDTFADIIEAFYSQYAKYRGKTIWGDKTPEYLLSLPLLAHHFSCAKFIHIIRDARDQILSTRKTWHKNLYRAAQRWHDDVGKCRENGRRLPPGKYWEVKYENLIEQPEEILAGICAFLDIPYEPQMTTLTMPTENLGDARQYIGILRANYLKWQAALSAQQILKIEKICGNLLRDLDYPVMYRGRTRKLSPITMGMFRCLDAAYMIRFEWRRQPSAVSTSWMKTIKWKNMK